MEKVYKMSEEGRRNISISHKGKPTWASKHPEEMGILFIGNKSNLGRKLPLKQRRNIGEGNKKAWKEGKRKSWNKGLTKETDERVMKISKINKETKANLGKKYPKEKYPNLGWRTSRKNQIFPVKDTSIEIKLQNFLKQMNVNFETHKVMPIKYRYQADILIPVQRNIKKPIVLEADGDYWHGNPEIFDMRKLPIRNRVQRVLDFERTNQLEEKGFRVIRLPEHKIRKMEVKDLMEIIP